MRHKFPIDPSEIFREDMMIVHTSDRLMVGCPGVAPGYVDLESTRSHGDPHPIFVVKSICYIFFVFFKFINFARNFAHLALNVYLLSLGSKF